MENGTSPRASAGTVATRSDVGDDEESLISDFFCPSGELGGGERELGPLYKGIFGLDRLWPLGVKRGHASYY